ncbi:MAG: hypothetical protein V7K22_23755 [Nostoc sp.]|uniref:hypothetical protein n=1 Tax=Nostoc sp. TaxID=1180 RepID=UPI002FF7D8D8
MDESNRDVYLYDRALAYLALNEQVKAQTDLALAIKLAKQNYEKDTKDWRNAFNLAIYYLAAQYTQPAKRFYSYVLSQGASFEFIREAIQVLNDFLTIFPNHVQATPIRQLLQSSLNSDKSLDNLYQRLKFPCNTPNPQNHYSFAKSLKAALLGCGRV